MEEKGSGGLKSGEDTWAESAESRNRATLGRLGIARQPKQEICGFLSLGLEIDLMDLAGGKKTSCISNWSGSSVPINTRHAG